MDLGIGLENNLNKTLYVVDIRFKQKNFNLLDYNIGKNDEVLSLTPYTSFLLTTLDYRYKTFHEILSEIEFHSLVLGEYQKIEKGFFKYKNYFFMFREFATIKTFEVYLKVLFDFFDSKLFDKYKIIYITDVNGVNNEVVSDASKSYIYKYNKFDKVIKVNSKDTFFYKKNYFYSKLRLLVLSLQKPKKVYNRFINKIELNYDNIYYKLIFKSIDKVNIEDINLSEDINNFIKDLEGILIRNNKNIVLIEQYNIVIENFKETNLKIIENKFLKIHPFTFLANNINFLEILYYTKYSIPKIFMQHGNYLDENIFLQYNEIYPADINFVFNDYTKKLFEKRGSKKVYSVGSTNFNKKIEERNKKYDFLYITYSGGYSYTGLQVMSYLNHVSIDANDIYMRHKKIIELFGKYFSDKKLCIKIQPSTALYSLYTPLLELSKKYKNIKIEFFYTLPYLIERSKYIISDYISSEFINRELHYQRDIILFKGSIFPLKKEILEDMKKMFILVDSIKELEEKIDNIDTIAKNRKRYDDIIEYYSSKKCNTKEIVNDILKKELKLLESK